MKKQLYNYDELSKEMDKRNSELKNYIGLYKIFAPKVTVEEQLGKFREKDNSLEANEFYLKKMETNDVGLYCIYVGITIKQSLKERIRNHLKHTDASGFRRHLQRINGWDEAGINAFIQKLTFEVTGYDIKDSSPETKMKIAIDEIDEINKCLRIFNDSNNYYPVAQEFIASFKKKKRSS